MAVEDFNFAVWIKAEDFGEPGLAWVILETALSNAIDQLNPNEPVRVVSLEIDLCE